MTSVETAVAEVQNAISEIAPELAGVIDFSKLPIDPETARAVTSAITDFDRRLHLLTVALDALNALLADGYPAVAMREVSASTLKDLQEEAARIEAALAKFESNEATSVTVTAESPVLK